MSDARVNIPLLRKAVEWAEAEAAKPVEFSQWNQAWYATEATELDRDSSCGTCYCIAGFVVAQEGLDDDAIYEQGGWWDAGRDLLGLDNDEAFSLFVSSNTIADVRRIAEEIAGERL